MIPAERQKRIAEILKTNGVVYVTNLSKEFGVSELTIRRDLDQMAANEILKRTHGGAVAIRNMSSEPHYRHKAEKFADAKRRIGLKAAELVEDGDTIMVNSGTTASAVLRALLESGKSLTIITNNVDVFNHDDPYGKCRIVALGGVYRSRSRSISGSMSYRSIQGIFANKSFIGIDGITKESGLTTPIYEECVTSQLMVNHTTGKVFVVAVHDKIGVISNYQIATLDKVGTIITDKEGADYFIEDSGFDIEVIEA